jgi:antagonist of KipI
MNQLEILDPGFVTTVQDLGRPGFERFGVPPAGAMDTFALLAGNRLVGNPPGAAGVEMALIGPELKVAEDCVMALTGTGFEMELTPPGKSGWVPPGWTAVYVRAGSNLRLRALSGHGWGCLAVSGGIDAPVVMGSRSTYWRGRFGGWQGRKLEAGDALPVGQAAGTLHALAGKHLPPRLRPAYSSNPVVEVIPGPQAGRFTQAGLDTFFSSSYTVTLESDRMGYRLEGARIEHQAGADILSEGLAPGSVQVPGSGQPLIAMSDRQTTGGYTKIATVIRADLPLVAQCPLGKGALRFQPTKVEAAQARYRAMLKNLEGIEEEDQDDDGH